jgi:hypothetical protein
MRADAQLRWLVIASASLIVAGCEERRLQAEAKDVLGEVMLDPTEILTRNLRRGSDGAGGEAICGEVNGKNRLGGFVGFKSFVAVTGDEPVVLLDQEISTDDFDYTYSQRVEQGAYTLAYQRHCASPEEKKEFATKMAEKAKRDAENAAYQAREDAKRAAEMKRVYDFLDETRRRSSAPADDQPLVDEYGNPIDD